MSWTGIRFDEAEYAERERRLRAAMAAHELDALVLSDDRHTWYATGFGDVGPIGSAARPRILVIPAAGDPAFYVHHSTRTTVAEMSFVPDVAPIASWRQRRWRRSGVSSPSAERAGSEPSSVGACASVRP